MSFFQGACPKQPTILLDAKWSLGLPINIQDINIHKSAIYIEFYELVYPIGIHIFPISYSLFPHGPVPAPPHVQDPL